MIYKFCLLALFYFTIRFAAASPLLQNSVNQHVFQGSSVFLQVGDQQYSRRSVNLPASLAKVYTAEMGLRVLGADHRFVYQAQWKQQGNEASDLEIISSGFPEFDARDLARRLKQKGIRVVHGDNKITSQQRLNKPKDRGQIGDSGYCYNALPQALNHSENCVNIQITSRGVTVSDPDLDMPISIGNINYNGEYSSTRPHFRWTNNAKTEFRYEIQVSLKNRSSVTDVNVVVPDTTKWMQNKIRRFGSSEGIEFRTSSTTRFSQSDAIAIGSEPLSDYACIALKDSVNVYAQIIYNATPSTQRNAFLSRYNASLVDGSGMSRSNRINGQGLMDLLYGVLESSDLSFYLNCMPSPGNGTLHSRMSGLSGKVSAKTGSLSGLSNLAGFIKNGSGQWVPFVFLLENRDRRVRELRRAQDNTMTAIQRGL
ncbi:MAG: D-alanyl-D-alanine carboxypeptidase/D-alanyl-D-alanine-endopeptidase [Bdellovibrionales bacterium]|nr:D-alanyl-D-alanine carboxypeptidase/D-alanyl-D-alanine-endopeptidase [Bdellovibrionales bacterium]